ncbi:MAG: PQQ-binding-like beta-propeller repeat protein [Actinomycetota bacterium]
MSHRPAKPKLPFGRLVLGLVIIGVLVAVWQVGFGGEEEKDQAKPVFLDSPTPSPEPHKPRRLHAATQPAAAEPINPDFPGLTTFRGNLTRTYYGEGPVPKHPKVLWRYPETGGMCGVSTDGTETKQWCGTGWNGQPTVVPQKDGSVEIRFGAYDYGYHFLNGRTGNEVHSTLRTGDLAKGSSTSDPDGYPLHYGGSRDNELRVIALDRQKPKELWSVNAETSVPNPVWNNDWDAAPLIVGDYLLEGSENSWFYVIKLNRDYDKAGKVTVDPRIVATVPGYDGALMAQIPDTDVSIESSVAYDDGIAYFGNSGGLIQGWDVSNTLKGGAKPRRVFRFWMGGENDASVVIDHGGFLYASSHFEPGDGRARKIGQLVKLDPRRKSNPVKWSVDATQPVDGDGGFFATPAIYGDMIYAASNSGELMGIDKDTGKVKWEVSLVPPVWSSPAVVDDVLVIGDCGGTVHGFDVSNPAKKPRKLWDVKLGSCIESTPAIWHGMIYIGSRGGAMFGLGDKR